MLGHMDLIGFAFSFLMGVGIGYALRRTLRRAQWKDCRPTNGVEKTVLWSDSAWRIHQFPATCCRSPVTGNVNFNEWKPWLL